MPIGNLLVPYSAIPAHDNSWLNKLVSTTGDAIDNKVAGDLIAQSLSTGQVPGAQTVPTNGVRQPVAQPQQSQSYAVPPIGAVSRGTPQGSTYAPFIETVRGGGLTNPYGLSAVKAYVHAESGGSPENAARTWSDPSESGAAGTSGGALSWRGPRLASLQNYASSKGEQGNGSPETQAQFFLQENPQVIQALNNAKSPQEANSILANAWKFAGYDRPGGENARRAALTQNYYANEFANAPQQQAEGGFDAGRFASGPVAQGAEGLAGALAGNAQAMQANNEPMPGVDQTTTGATAAPPIVATPTNSDPVPLGAPVDNQLAGPVTQLTRQNLSPDLIRRMVQNPVTRQLGLGLAQQVLGGGKASEPWQFVKLANGDLARANQQTGAIERVGNFAKNSKNGESEAGLNLVYGQDANGTTVAFQPLKGGGLRQVELPDGVKLTPGVTNTDLGTSVITRNNKTGAVIDTQNKDVAGVAEQTTQGKAKGEAAAELPATEAAANMVAKQIQELKDDPYLPSMVGSVDARLPNLSTDAARVQGRMNQIQGGAFLQARQMLKGGGAITDFEGAKAEDAYARLNAAQNINDYKQALDDFNEAVQIGLRKLQKQAGAVPTQSNNYKDRYGLE